MELIKQVTSVKLSNKLHDLGVTAPSIFYREWKDAGEYEIESWNEKFEHGYCEDNVNCYTVAELGEIMKSTAMECVWFEEKSQWGCFGTLDGIDTFFADTEAEARGLRLAYLLENKLI